MKNEAWESWNHKKKNFECRKFSISPVRPVHFPFCEFFFSSQPFSSCLISMQFSQFMWRFPFCEFFFSSAFFKLSYFYAILAIYVKVCEGTKLNSESFESHEHSCLIPLALLNLESKNPFSSLKNHQSRYGSDLHYFLFVSSCNPLFLLLYQ